MPHMLVGTCAALVAACFAFTAFAADVHLSQTGSDAADGSRETPVEILVADGRYELSQPVVLSPDDFGTEKSPTIIRTSAGS